MRSARLLLTTLVFCGLFALPVFGQVLTGEDGHSYYTTDNDRSRVYCGGYDENGNYVPCPDSDSNSFLGRAQQQYQDLKDSFEKNTGLDQDSNDWD